jgi:hypothetical protein
MNDILKFIQRDIVLNHNIEFSSKFNSFLTPKKSVTNEKLQRITKKKEKRITHKDQ